MVPGGAVELQCIPRDGCVPELLAASRALLNFVRAADLLMDITGSAPSIAEVGAMRMARWRRAVEVCGP